MKKLLIPVDFSETSQMAVDFGLQLAEKCGYHIILHHSVDFLHTYESMYVDAPQAHFFTEKVIDDMEVRLDNLYTRCKSDQVSISKELTSGSLVHDIREIAKENEVDLIVMGTKGASGMKEFFVGSNTEKVVRLVDCPVISIPKKVETSSIRSILVPIDLGEIRPSFLHQVSILQQLFSASIEFLWVKTPHDIENIELIEEEFNALLSAYEIASSSFTVIKNIFPQDGVLEYSKNTSTDMIAMLTHSRRGLAHWFSGSMTEDVMNHSETPLWSFKINEVEKPISLDNFQKLKSLNTL